MSNTTAEKEKPNLQASNLGQTPPQGQTSQSSTAAQPQKPAAPLQKPAAQDLVKPANQSPQEEATGHQQTSADVSQKAPVASQNAQAASPNQSNGMQPVQSPVHADQPVKEAAALQPNKPSIVGQPQTPAPVQSHAPTAQPQLPAKPVSGNSLPPAQQKPTLAAMQSQMKDEHGHQPIAPSQNQNPTHRPPSRRPTTPKVSRFAGQLATATRPENIHHLFQPTGPLRRPTSEIKNQQSVMQLFPAKGKYRDEE